MAEQSDTSTRFEPRFDVKGLLTAIVVDAANEAVLMVAHMNADALTLTRTTGVVHFYSRSRQTLWRKGETSGNFLTLVDLRVDCDQDAVLVRVTPAGPACHTGRPSCFYRRVEDDGTLVFLTADD